MSAKDYETFLWSETKMNSIVIQQFFSLCMIITFFIDWLSSV